ncbi:hypothetical protein ACFORJ_05765 [Corynebacterium hansenii]|uniref:Secreted protein n=1 Tax=Corynebacterium hansenii TaxID=394964 RepID=A0ABV7ZMC6_9CORY|nr:hypothetical protein [Corynebacterium hansenii]WJZ00250.1 hypothetical protein CHAN_08205 [Corynebacterium hansenii]
MSSLQPYQSNPIAQRKEAVRRYSRNAVVWTGGGLAAGVALGLLASSMSLFIILTVIGVVGGFINWQKVQRIVNHRDNQ